MTRALPRANFNSSRLIRLLADLALVDPTQPGGALGDSLGLWLDFTDAIELYAVHNESYQMPQAASAAETSPERVGFAVALARTRRDLVHAITASCSPGGGKTRIKLPIPDLDAPIEIAASYEPYRRFHLAHQRDIESAVRPLRVAVREAMNHASPALKKLAALDQTFDGVLAERESRLLSSVPWLLEKRFAQSFLAHQQTLAAGEKADDRAGWLATGGWLTGFFREVHTLLLAEVDLRLQPVTGLIEAFNNEVITEQ